MSLQYLIWFTTCLSVSGHFEVINRVLFITVVDILNVILRNSCFLNSQNSVWYCGYAKFSAIKNFASIC